MAKKMKKNKSKKIKPEIDQVIIDENGFRIGDDGYPMTKARRGLHNTLNAMLIWGYISCFVAVVCVLAAFFQNQSFTPTEFIYYGGTMYNGHEVATLLRIEALCTFIAGLLAVMLSHRCFNWLYDKGDEDILAKFYIAILVIAGGWNLYLVAFVQLADPVTILMATFAFLMVWFMAKTKTERRSLRPSVPASSR